jgi:hypothetical protein
VIGMRLSVSCLPTNHQLKILLRRQTSYFSDDRQDRIDNSLRMIDLNHVPAVNKHLRSVCGERHKLFLHSSKRVILGRSCTFG